MDIKDLPEVKRWLNQFDIPDQYLAEYMLKKLRYVSLEEVEEWIQKAVNNLLEDIKKGNNNRMESVAIFPVTKNTENVFNRNKELKAANDSSGRIGHALKNIERGFTSHIEVSPRVESMRSKKVRHIIYVDDFTGTGERFKKFWRGVSPSIKSWCSHGWCKIWVISFAAHNEGLRKIVSNVGPVSEDQIRYGYLIKNGLFSQNLNLHHLCRKYGKRLSEKQTVLGYGAQLSPIVFQYGCPNNAPAILWCKGSSSEKAFKPLFPNRSVPVELFPLFHSEVDVNTTAEDLWIARNYALALAFLEKPELYNDQYELLTILSYLKNGRSPDNVRELMVMSDDSVNSYLESLKTYGLIDSACTITRFGKDILLRGGKSKFNKRRDKSDYKNFYPRSFLGFQREV